MAQVTQTAQQRIDQVLEYSLAEWVGLSEVEATIDEWDIIEQIDFIEEWTLAEERLLELSRYAATVAFTEEQRARYRALKQIIARNRPIIARLRAS